MQSSSWGTIQVNCDTPLPPIGRAALTQHMNALSMTMPLREPYSTDHNSLLDHVWLFTSLTDMASHVRHGVSEAYWTDHRPVWCRVPVANLPQ